MVTRRVETSKKKRKKRRKGGKCKRVGGGRGEEEVHSNYRNPGDPLLHQPSPPCPLHINRTPATTTTASYFNLHPHRNGLLSEFYL